MSNIVENSFQIQTRINMLDQSHSSLCKMQLFSNQEKPIKISGSKMNASDGSEETFHSFVRINFFKYISKDASQNKKRLKRKPMHLIRNS